MSAFFASCKTELTKQMNLFDGFNVNEHRVLMRLIHGYASHLL